MPNNIAVISSELASIEVSDDGGATYEAVPNAQSWVESGGDLNQRQVKTFDGSATKLGLPDVSSFTMSALHLPHHASWVMIDDASRDGTALTWRITTRPDIVFEGGATAPSFAITSPGGVVSFSGAGAPVFTTGAYAPGMTIETGTTFYIIDSISATGTVTVKPAPGTAVTPTPDFSIRTPSLRLVVLAVPGKPPAALENEGDLSTSISVYPRALVPKWSVIRTHS